MRERGEILDEMERRIDFLRQAIRALERAPQRTFGGRQEKGALTVAEKASRIAEAQGKLDALTSLRNWAVLPYDNADLC